MNFRAIKYSLANGQNAGLTGGLVVVVAVVAYAGGWPAGTLTAALALLASGALYWSGYANFAAVQRNNATAAVENWVATAGTAAESKRRAEQAWLMSPIDLAEEEGLEVHAPTFNQNGLTMTPGGAFDVAGNPLGSAELDGMVKHPSLGTWVGAADAYSTPHGIDD